MKEGSSGAGARSVEVQALHLREKTLSTAPPPGASVVCAPAACRAGPAVCKLDSTHRDLGSTPRSVHFPSRFERVGTFKSGRSTLTRVGCRVAHEAHSHQSARNELRHTIVVASTSHCPRGRAETSAGARRNTMSMQCSAARILRTSLAVFIVVRALTMARLQASLQGCACAQ